MFDDVWFGIHANQEGCDFEDVKQICLEAEKQGYDLFTIMDHFMNQFPPYEKGAHSIEAWTTLAGLAAVTDRIKLGTLVTCYGYRRPTILAKMATTVDIISNGRLIFGIGAGWHEGEFKAFMGRYPPAKERLRGLEESVEICKRMFTEETSSYKGKLYQVENVLNSPPPIQEHIPIMIGGGGEKRTLKIVAKHGDISHFFPWEGVKTVESKLAALRRHCKTVGRDFEEIRKGVGFVITLGSSEDEVEGKMKKMADIMGLSMENALKVLARWRAHVMISGSADDVARELSNYRDLGLGLYTFSILPSPTDEDIRLLYDEVMPVLC